jgi:hypothetical protein
MTNTHGPYHRKGEPGGPSCPVAVLPIGFKSQTGEAKTGFLLDAGTDSSEIELLRTVVSRLGYRWGHDEFGWWAVLQVDSFPSWSVWRQDDNGNRFLVHANLSEPEAKRQVEQFESLGHKQCYWAQDDTLRAS